MVSGIANTAIVEFQGWIRSTTYVTHSGNYLVACQGVHTVYVRNNNMTHILAGDVYTQPLVNQPQSVDNGLSNKNKRGSLLRTRMVSSVYLRAGIVGLVAPIRGTFVCLGTCRHCERGVWQEA